MFVNLGDKRAGSRGAGTTSGLAGRKPQGERTGKSTKSYTGESFGRRKGKMMLPHRYAIGVQDGLADHAPDGEGWIMRQDQVWKKLSAMPEPVTDRTRDTHEYWFHLVKNESYYTALDLIREPHTGGSNPSGKNATVQDWRSGNGIGHRAAHNDPETYHPLGARPGSVWSPAMEPLVVPADVLADADLHTAAFPSWWPQQFIRGWCPPAICTECGKGRRPHVAAITVGDRNPYSIDGSRARSTIKGGSAEWAQRMENPDVIDGWVCDCTPFVEIPGARGAKRFEYLWDDWDPAPTRPAVVFDPFGGSGTTAITAYALGRHGISNDLSAGYQRLAEWRLNDSDLVNKVHRRVYGVGKIPAKPAMEGQLGMFG
jgi:hypothetical protein